MLSKLFDMDLAKAYLSILNAIKLIITVILCYICGLTLNYVYGLTFYY